MTRTFSTGSGSSRKLVKLVVEGHRVGVIEGTPDGAAKKSEKELPNEAQARAACEKMALALISRGYLEHASAAAAPANPKPAPNRVLELLDEEPAAEVAPLLPRLAPNAEPDPAKKKTGRKKKRKPTPENGDGLDKRVIAAAAAAAIAFIAFLGYVVYDTFLVTPSIVGHWVGSNLEYEVSKSISLTQYELTLDERNHAVMTQQKLASSGTYTYKGDRLKLTLKGEEGEPFNIEYKASVGRLTMALYDPTSGKKTVELMRDRNAPSAPSTTPKLSKDLAAGATAKADPDADAKLASVVFAPADGAFKVRHPPGWQAETGARADNSYSWARFTRGSAKIQINADVTGSLLSGSDSAGQHEEGSASAPVHVAHLSNLNGVSQDFSDYKETAPTLFKGSSLGEGRVAAFSASGGMFSSKIRGLRVTLLTGDRRITVLCQCPDEEFAKLKPTFLAVARSLSR